MLFLVPLQVFFFFFSNYFSVWGQTVVEGVRCINLSPFVAIGYLLLLYVCVYLVGIKYCYVFISFKWLLGSFIAACFAWRASKHKCCCRWFLVLLGGSHAVLGSKHFRVSTRFAAVSKEWVCNYLSRFWREIISSSELGNNFSCQQPGSHCKWIGGVIWGQGFLKILLQVYVSSWTLRLTN